LHHPLYIMMLHHIPNLFLGLWYTKTIILLGIDL